jgi:hypothetical protein
MMAKFTKPSKETIAAQSEAVFGAVLPEDVGNLLLRSHR